MTYGLFHDLTIKASLEEVFTAITTSEELDKWWTKESAGQPKVGTTYQFYFAPEYDWQAKVVRCQVNQRIYFEMTQADQDWEETQLRFVLSEANGVTVLRFEHVGWESNNDHFRRTSYCWAIYLHGLKKYLEQGIVIPYDLRSQV